LSKFRAKITEVEAALFDGHLVGKPSLTDPTKVEPLTCPDWFPAVMEKKAPNDFGWAHGDMCTLGDKIYLGRQDGDNVKTVTVHPGDWFIRLPSGLLRHVTGDEFAATFEPVSD
jgi:hypothetical protein